MIKFAFHRTVLSALAIAAANPTLAQPANLASVRARLPQDEVIYFLLPDRFENGDTSNDRGGLSGGPLTTGFDPAHKGLLVLTATLRNRATYAIGYPHLELTLTDASDQVVVRRALAPAEYVSGTVNTAAGIPGNGEIPVKLFIDASATVQAGYRLYLFFP